MILVVQFGSYSNNESSVFTICPSVVGNFVSVNFTTFSLENNFDFLEIFNGPHDRFQRSLELTQEVERWATRLRPSDPGGMPHVLGLPRM